MKKVKISFKYECEEIINDDEVEIIKENLQNINLKEDIKNILDEYLQGEGTTEEDSKLSEYKLEFLNI